MYTFTKLHDRRIPIVGVGVRVGVGPMKFQLNGHPREENRACPTSRRGSSCVTGSWRTKLSLWQAEQGSRRTRRHPRDDPRADVGEDVRVGVSVRVGIVECQLYSTELQTNAYRNPRQVLAEAVDAA